MTDGHPDEPVELAEASRPRIPCGMASPPAQRAAPARGDRTCRKPFGGFRLGVTAVAGH
jgi:hypothetical protein